MGPASLFFKKIILILLFLSSDLFNLILIMTLGQCILY